MSAIAACSSDDERVDGVFTQEEWETVQTLSPLPDPPLDTTNGHGDDPAAAALGQRFFFDTAFSGPILTGSDGMNGGLGAAGETGKVACASCHLGEWFIDVRSSPNNASLGTDWLPRNANSIVNAVYYEPWVKNDGISDSFWSGALTDPELPIAMNGSRLRVAHVIHDKYRDEYDAVFEPDLPAELDPTSPSAGRFPPDGKPGDPAYDGMAPEDQRIVSTIFANFGKAIEAYERLIISRDAPIDRYVAGDTGAIGAEAKSGLKLFVGKANCVACHEGPHLSDDLFHVNGLRPEGPNIVPEETGRAAVIQHVLDNPFNSNGEFSDDRDTGRLDGLASTDEAIGQWRTKGLRQAKETGPYMHTGQFASLREVVEFYNGGGHDEGFVGRKDELMKPLNLTDREIDDLVAFLETLTGQPVPAALREDTSAP